MERIIFSECVLGLPVLHVEQPARNYPPCNSSSSCSRQPEKHLPGLTDHAWPDHRHGSPTDLRRYQRQVEIQMGRRRPLILLGTAGDLIFLATLGWSGGLGWLAVSYMGL